MGEKAVNIAHDILIFLLMRKIIIKPILDISNSVNKANFGYNIIIILDYSNNYYNM